MILRSKLILTPVLLMTLLSVPDLATVAEIIGNFTGTIQRSFDDVNTLGFGSGSGVLDGRTVTGTIGWNTDFAPADGDPDPNLGDYATMGVLDDPWLFFNNKLKLITRKSYGFRTQEAYETALYHTLGALPEPDFTHRFF